MCGVSGLLHWGKIQDAKKLIKSSADSIVHRGPDDEGFWADSNISLGFRRLSIVDLDGGTQPMSDASDQVHVVFNGEIYNHLELRRDLIARGHIFKTSHSDTEVFVHGWKEWGEDLFSKLNGMFAVAIWDTRSGERLILARDRYGIKPLYVGSLSDGGIVFSSEVRGIFATGLIKKSPSPEGIYEYFSFQNNWFGRTMFKHIELFPNGTFEVFSRHSRKRKQFWDYSFPRNSKIALSEASVRHRDILASAVHRQMQADVPVMTYLSGGIDSSAVTVAAHNIVNNVKAYSCIFDLENVGEDLIVDEREFSRALANDLKISRVEVELPQDILTTTLDRTIRALEYPRMGMTYVNFLIAERVSHDAKVVLSGLGGDEIHGGYLGRYQIVPRHPWWKKLFGSDPLKRYRQTLHFVIPEDHRKQAFTKSFLNESKEFSPSGEIDRLFDQAPSKDPWDVVMYGDATTYMQGLLVLEDKLSMASSLETRVPLLDNELVDFAFTLPWQQLCDNRMGKIIFREAVRPWVPEVIYNKPKMGFGPPDSSWYRGRLKNWVATTLSPKKIAARGVLNPDYVEKRLDDHFSGRANNVVFIWSLLSFESWCNQHDFFGGSLDQ